MTRCERSTASADNYEQANSLVAVDVNGLVADAHIARFASACVSYQITRIKKIIIRDDTCDGIFHQRKKSDE